MSIETDELKNRIEAKRHELLTRWNELKADTRAEAGKLRDNVKDHLDELEKVMKQGWESVSEQVRTKVNTILANRDSH